MSLKQSQKKGTRESKYDISSFCNIVHLLQQLLGWIPQKKVINPLCISSEFIFTCEISSKLLISSSNATKIRTFKNINTIAITLSTGEDTFMCIISMCD